MGPYGMNPTWILWIVIFSFVVLLLLSACLILLYFKYMEKATIVRFVTAHPSNIFSIGKDSKGIIHPKIRFYDQSKALSIYARRDSGVIKVLSAADLEQGTLDEQPIHPSSSIIHERKGSLPLPRFPTNDDFDTISTCYVSRMSTPLKPLAPAYASCEKMEISTIPCKLSSCLREDEIVLPPGYVTHMNDTNQIKCC